MMWAVSSSCLYIESFDDHKWSTNYYFELCYLLSQSRDDNETRLWRERKLRPEKNFDNENETNNYENENSEVVKVWHVCITFDIAVGINWFYKPNWLNLFGMNHSCNYAWRSIKISGIWTYLLE